MKIELYCIIKDYENDMINFINTTLRPMIYKLENDSTNLYYTKIHDNSMADTFDDEFKQELKIIVQNVIIALENKIDEIHAKIVNILNSDEISSEEALKTSYELVNPSNIQKPILNNIGDYYFELKNSAIKISDKLSDNVISELKLKCQGALNAYEEVRIRARKLSNNALMQEEMLVLARQKQKEYDVLNEELTHLIKNVQMFEEEICVLIKHTIYRYQEEITSSISLNKKAINGINNLKQRINGTQIENNIQPETKIK